MKQNGILVHSTGGRSTLPPFFHHKYHPQHLHYSTKRSLRVVKAAMSNTAGQVIKCKGRYQLDLSLSAFYYCFFVWVDHLI